MNTIDDDIEEWERHSKQVDLLKATNPKVERIRARRDVKVARAGSMTQDARIARYLAAAAAAALLGISGCSAVVWGHSDPPPTQQQIENEHQQKMACIDKKGTWWHGACDF